MDDRNDLGDLLRAREESRAYEDLMVTVIVMAAVLAGLGAGVQWLDAHFGWGMWEWVTSTIESALTSDGAK